MNQEWIFLGTGPGPYREVLKSKFRIFSYKNRILLTFTEKSDVGLGGEGVTRMCHCIFSVLTSWTVFTLWFVENTLKLFTP
jgi:hypothetical protein